MREVHKQSKNTETTSYVLARTGFEERALSQVEADKSSMQRFELDLEGNRGLYKYELSVEHQDVERLSPVHWEKLSFDNRPLFELISVRTETH
jgi:hypothetical protein